MSPPHPGAAAAPVRLATRGSRLARAQTDLVAALLCERAPGLVIEPVIVKTRGDLDVQSSLDQIGGQGVFVTEVQAAVLDGRADVAVHSAKDLPPREFAGLSLSSVPLRADPRDALVGCKLKDLRPGATVATGSARRRAQLANLRPDLTFVELRGNMETRLSRAGDRDVDAVVVAVAALQRLRLMAQVSEVLSPTVMLPQIGQGAIALECREDDHATLERVGAIDNEQAHRALRAERALLATLGGSCSLPVGGLAEVSEHETTVTLFALLASGDGRVLVRASGRGEDPERLGQELARRLMADGGASSLEEEWPDPATSPL